MAKILALMIALTLIASPCLAGQTTISGTMSCYMPELIEMEQKPAEGRQSKTPEAKSSEEIQLTSQQRPSQETQMTMKESKEIRNGEDGQETITVFTVCAK